ALIVEDVDHVGLEKQARPADRYAVVEREARLVNVIEPELAAFAEEVRYLRRRKCVTRIGDAVRIRGASSGIDRGKGVVRDSGVISLQHGEIEVADREGHVVLQPDICSVPNIRR